MLIKTKAIVLRSIKYGDKKLIVDLTTEALGHVTSCVKVSTSPKGKLKKQFFQPLTVLNIEIDHRQRQQMQTIKEAQLQMPWVSLTTNPVKMTIGMFLAEILYHVSRQEQEDVPLFRFIETSLSWLDTTEDGIANFHIIFLIRLTLFLGFMPSAEEYREGAIFDLRSGEFMLTAPLHRDFLTPQDSALMLRLLRITYPTMHILRMSQADRRRCLDIILQFYRLHLPSFPELKSLPVLHEVFS